MNGTSNFLAHEAWAGVGGHATGCGLAMTPFKNRSKR